MTMTNETRTLKMMSRMMTTTMTTTMKTTMITKTKKVRITIDNNAIICL
jgi:hypothetical protein